MHVNDVCRLWLLLRPLALVRLPHAGQRLSPLWHSFGQRLDALRLPHTHYSPTYKNELKRTYIGVWGGGANITTVHTQERLGITLLKVDSYAFGKAE